jgi:tetratricopeptide (TPR) repeat protein
MSKDKQEALKAAKAAWENGQHPDQAKKVEISGKKNETVTVTEADLPEARVLLLKGSRGTKFHIKDCKVLKLLVENCHNCHITMSKFSLLSGTCELWTCQGVTFTADAFIGTIQLDSCKKMSIRLPAKDSLAQLVQAGVHDLSVAFDDITHNFVSGFEHLKGEHKELTPSDSSTQFITRLVEGNFMTEKVIRLVHDYPTTLREIEKFNKEGQATEEKIREMTESVLGHALSEEEEKKVKDLKAQLDARKESSHAPEARAEVRKLKGNEEFKEGNVAQALVSYTEAILAFPTAPVYANRAQCFLKLQQWEKALEDCDACLKLEPGYGVKAQFRRGLALMELGRYAEAGMCFSLTLELEPQNKNARSSLAMAQMKLRKAATATK